jgi:hypothetical protein
MGDQIKGPADFLELGDYNARCSMCGAKEKASKMVKNWQGLWRHPRCNEPRQPQDFVRGLQDIQTPPWVQTDEDVNEMVCTLNGSSAVPGWAVPGCSIPGRRYTVPVSGQFGFTFTSNVAGQVSGTLTQPIPFLIGTYRTHFDDGEVRNVTFTGVNASWLPALRSTPAGLFIDSCYTNVGAS